MYYDFWTQMYQMYTVFSSDLVIDIVNTGAAPIGVAIVPVISTGSISSFDYARETPRSVFKIISPAGT